MDYLLISFFEKKNKKILLFLVLLNYSFGPILKKLQSTFFNFKS